MENAEKFGTSPASQDAPPPQKAGLQAPHPVTKQNAPPLAPTPAIATTGGTIHRIADDNDMDESALSAAGPGASETGPAAFARQGVRSPASTHAGSVATARVNDVRPPYRPPQALRMNIARAQAVQPPLISMSDGRRTSIPLPGGMESAV